MMISTEHDQKECAAYTKEEREKYDHVYDNTFVAITDGELVKGLVVGSHVRRMW